MSKSKTKVKRRRRPDARRRSETVDVPIYGMDCQGCAVTVEMSLGALPGVESVNADFKRSRVTVTGNGDALQRDRLANSIEELGYSATQDAAAFDDIAPRGLLRQNWKALLAFVVIGTAIIAGGIYAYQWSQDYFFDGGRVDDITSLFSSVSPAAFGLSFAIGLIIAFSPFTFALAPAVMGYVASSKQNSRLDAARLSAGFVGGIMTIDVILGAIFATLGSAAIAFLGDRLPAWYAIITVLLLGLGLVLLRVWKVDIPTFMPKMHKTSSIRDAYAAGLPFGLIACPACTPLLLPVALGAAATGNALYGAALMGAFALGRGIPLVVLGTSTSAFQRMKGFTQYVPWVEKTVGVLLLAGSAFFAWQFFRVASFFN